jgi:uncharacterized protein (TIGR02145 family)
MAKTNDLPFDGGAIVDAGGGTASDQVHNVFLREITVIDAGRESHIYALFDMDKPTNTAPYFEPVSASNLADWCIHGDAVQVDLKEAMNYSGDRYAGLLQDVTLSNIPGSGVYVRECTLRTMQKRGSTGVRFAWFGLSLIMDQSTSISYLATPVYNNPVMLDVPDHKVQVEQTDNPNYLAYKVIGDGSTVNVDIVRETPLGQPVDPYLRISARKTTDVIKWSEVLASETKSAFEARIQSDIAAGVEPVLLDDTDSLHRIAILSGRNTYVDGQQVERFSVFRTTANERSFTNFIPGKGITELKYLDSLLKNGAAGYNESTGLVSVHNDRTSVYTYTGSNTLDFLVSPIDGMAPNFAVKITSTAQEDGTVTVYKKTNGLYVPLMPSVAGGTTVEAGKTYQLTCVGDCWTLAEFEEPTQGLSMAIGGKRYKVVRIGNLYWMAENLDYTWNGLNFPATSISTTEPDANYYNGTLSGSYGLLYSGTARDYMISHASELGFGAWRIPSSNDFIDLMDAVGLETSGTKLRATSVWADGGGTDDYGFDAYPTGAMHGEGALMGQPAYTYDEETTRTGFWASDNSGDSYVRLGLQSGDTVAALGDQNKFSGHSVRLCMDA